MSRFFIGRPIVAIVIAVVTVLGGAVALAGLPIALFPQIVPPQIDARHQITALAMASRALREVHACTGFEHRRRHFAVVLRGGPGQATGREQARHRNENGESRVHGASLYSRELNSTNQSQKGHDHPDPRCRACDSLDRHRYRPDG